MSLARPVPHSCCCCTASRSRASRGATSWRRSPPPGSTPSLPTSVATRPVCARSDIASYATPRLVADVLDLAERLGAETFHLVGHDWGGQVAWLTAAATIPTA